MSKGYFAIKPIVFHSQEQKEQFLASNSDYIHIPKKLIMQLMKSYEEKEIVCGSCDNKHPVGKIQWSKLK